MSACKRPKRNREILLMIIIFAGVHILYAQWTLDPKVSTPVGIADDDQFAPRAVKDEAGGAIVTWEDYRDGYSSSHVYAQRLDVDGVARWTPNGIRVAMNGSQQLFPTIICDGSGGAIVIWVDSRNGSDDIYAQRIDSSGNLLWSTEGVPVCAATGRQAAVHAVEDGAGGAYVTWQDERNASSGRDVYIQRLSADGANLWAPEGVSVCTVTGSQGEPRVANSGPTGPVVVWTDERTSYADGDIFAQGFDSTGARQWPSNGIPVCRANGRQSSPSLIADGVGGSIIAWNDARNGGPDVRVFAQRISESGQPMWTHDGVPVSSGSGGFDPDGIAPDDSGGAIIVFRDYTPAMKAQRLSPAGSLLWPNAVTLCETYSGKGRCVPNGTGGAIVAWADSRDAAGQVYSVFAQGVDNQGTVAWSPGGIVVRDMRGNPFAPLGGYYPNASVVLTDSGGAIVFFETRASDTTYDYDVCAQNITRDGNLGRAPHPVSPVNGDTVTRALRWNSSLGATMYEVQISETPAFATVVADTSVPDTLVLLSPLNQGGYFWRVRGQNVEGLHSGVSDFSPVQPFQYDPTLPVQLASFVAVQFGTEVRIDWTTMSEVNNFGYIVQKKAVSDSGFQDLPGSFVQGHGTTTEPHMYSFVDSSTSAIGDEYRLKQLDLDGTVHLSWIIGLQTGTGTREDLPAGGFLLGQNFPNPFNPVTSIEFQLPAAGFAALKVYDILGREVGTLVNENMSPGVHTATWDASGMASGVYYCRLSFGGKLETRSMVVAR